MIDIDQLEEQFSIEGEVGFAELENELIFITVSNRYADADICLYGAHVTSFRPHNTMDVLWMSPESKFEVGTPIRGGIPVCFPWFGPHKTEPEKPMHGFARLMYWEVAETASLPGGETSVRLQLCSSEATKVFWPYDFCAELNLTVGRKLTVALKVANTSDQPMEYTCALHSYFSLSLIDNISITGLQNTAYHNQLDGSDGFQDTEKLEIHRPETRHYFNTEAPCVIEDPVFRRKIGIEKSGSKITTVWNPGQETCSKMADLPDDGYLTFVCVETVNAFENVVRIAPGESHETSAIIGLSD